MSVYGKVILLRMMHFFDFPGAFGFPNNQRPRLCIVLLEPDRLVGSNPFFYHPPHLKDNTPPPAGPGGHVFKFSGGLRSPRAPIDPGFV